jgi:hypothetical protein
VCDQLLQHALVLGAHVQQGAPSPQLDLQLRVLVVAERVLVGPVRVALVVAARGLRKVGRLLRRYLQRRRPPAAPATTTSSPATPTAAAAATTTSSTAPANTTSSTATAASPLAPAAPVASAVPAAPASAAPAGCVRLCLGLQHPHQRLPPLLRLLLGATTATISSAATTISPASAAAAPSPPPPAALGLAAIHGVMISRSPKPAPVNNTLACCLLRAHGGRLHTHGRGRKESCASMLHFS